MNSSQVRKTNKANLPEVLSELGRLGTDKHVLVMRIVRYQHPLIGKSPPMLDIRHFIEDKKNPDGTVFTGFSNGISLTIADLLILKDSISDIIAAVEKFTTKSK